MKVKFKKLSNNAVMPKKAHASDAGFDLVATSREVDDYGNVVYGTGLAVEIPEGYVGFAFPRSSVSKYDIVMANSTGVIDSNFRGEMKFKFRPVEVFQKIAPNFDDDIDDSGVIDEDLASTLRFIPRVGDRIAQLIIMPYPEIDFEEADTLTDTDRGTGGYGSTGK